MNAHRHARCALSIRKTVTRPMKQPLLMSALLLCSWAHADTLRFVFDGKPSPGDVVVRADSVYSAERHNGYEPGPERNAAGLPFLFSVDLPEGNYRVTATLGGAAASDTTIKAEQRRLMVDGVELAAGASEERSFIVNVRTPAIAAVPGVRAGAVKLKEPSETADSFNWDQKLTLEINGPQPALRRLVIEPATVPTVFLLGDSTVTDQRREPFASWGQMLTGLFKPTVAISNHAMSGEAYRDSLARRRLDKILSMMQPGDTVLMQFGHNDQKQKKDGSGDAETYKAEIRTHAERILARGGVPVVVSSMERRVFNAEGKLKPSLAEYAEAARTAAQEMKLAFVDLNAMSVQFYEALGPSRSPQAQAINSKKQLDNTHHNNYGAMQMARMVALGLRQAKVPVASELRDDLPAIVPSDPPAPKQFRFAASPGFTDERPLGN